jgi:hypothetical protein
MKKLLVLSLVLVVSIVSYGQVIEKQTTYVLKMTEQEYNEYVKSKEQKEVVVVNVPKVRVEPIKSDKEGSFGAMAGVTTMIGEAGSFINFSGGGWVEYKNYGIEYITSASVTNDMMATDYISGKVGKWIAGGASKSYGIFYKQDNGLYYGGGVQNSLIIGLENVTNTVGGQIRNGIKYPTYSTVIPKDINESKTLPYFTIGYMKNLGEWFTFRGGILVSKFTSINVGVGYSF